MSKYLLWGLALAGAAILTVLSITARPFRTDREEMVRIREQVRPQTRLGFHDLPENGKPHRWTGVLLDAGCPTREMFVPGAAPLGKPATAGGNAGGGAAGVAPGGSAGSAAGGGAAGMAPGGPAGSVGAGMAAGQQATGAAAAPVSPEIVSRQIDAGCAVTGATRGFALYLSGGELKNLDEGGNTKALEAFQDNPTGRAVMAGQAPGANPRAEVTGRVQGDRLIVDEIRLL